MHKREKLAVLACVLASGLALGTSNRPAHAEDMAMEPQHRIIIQVSTGDSRTQTIALNNAVNLQKAFGRDNVDVQVVAYGPGLSLLTKNSKNRERVESLAVEGVSFNACANTMRKIERKKGKKPELAEGVTVVSGGVKRILELQEQGYGYIRP